MAQVVDRWHLSRSIPGAVCQEHSTKTYYPTPSAGHGQGDRWQVRYRDAAGVQRKENFARKPDAERRAAEITTDLDKGRNPYQEQKHITFREYAEQWRKAQPHRPNTARSTEMCLRRYVYPAFGDRRLTSIRPSEIQAWLTGLVKTHGLSAATAKRANQVIRAVFNTAVRDRLMDASPCAGVTPPPLPHREIRPLTSEEVHRLAQAMPYHYYSLVLFAAGSGLRPGELFGLQAKHIDFGRQTVKVEQQSQRGVICPPKTEHSYRTVPVPRVAINAAYPLRHSDDCHPDGFVFTDENGRPIHAARFSEVWRDAVEKAGLPKGTRLHDLRHTYASVLIAAGKGPKTVAARLGDTVAVAMGTYAHLFPDEDEATREIVGDFLSAPDVPSEDP